MAGSVTDISFAVQLYYERLELSNPDIAKLFGVKSSKTVAQLKKPVREEMAKRNLLPWNSNCVNTEVAFEVWGLDIKDLEKRREKILKLKKSKGESL